MWRIRRGVLGALCVAGLFGAMAAARLASLVSGGEVLVTPLEAREGRLRYELRAGGGMASSVVAIEPLCECVDVEAVVEGGEGAGSRIAVVRVDPRRVVGGIRPMVLLKLRNGNGGHSVLVPLHP